MPRPVWTPEQARAMGDKGRAAQHAAQAAKRQQCANLPFLAQDLSFPDQCLALTRARILDTFSRIGEETGKSTCDGQRLNWLASALERLAELERILDGRPLPGSRRPPPLDTAKPTQRPPAAPIPSGSEGEPQRASSHNAPHPAIPAPLPRLDQPSTPSPSGASDLVDEPEGIDYGPID